jgi:hypothetical protein
MKPELTLPLAALLITSACALNRTHAEPASSPPIADLVCPAEPDIAASLVTDPSGLLFDIGTRAAGEACRDALHRVCEWHKARGVSVDCDKPSSQPLGTP